MDGHASFGYWVRCRKVLGLTQLALARQAAERATRLHAAAASSRAQRRPPLAPAERGHQQLAFAAARAQLGDAAFDAAWAAGQLRPKVVGHAANCMVQ